MRVISCPEYSLVDAQARWREPKPEQVNAACPWCASYLFPAEEKLKGQYALFGQLAECRNLMCPMAQNGKSYWEPHPEGWTEENKWKWLEKEV